MEWVSDPSRGHWLRERLDESYDTMHCAVPRGFAAYARVFHSGRVRELPGGRVPSFDEWNALSEAEQQSLIERFVDAPARWADAAAAFGTTLHPLAQWHRLVRASDGTDQGPHRAPDGREFDGGQEGSMDAGAFAALAEHLIAHTDTPQQGVTGLWEGWGGLLGGKGTNGRAFFTLTAETAPQRALRRMKRALAHSPFAPKNWVDGILSHEITQGPKLELPGRNYVLFAGDLTVFARPEWILEVPWRDHIGEAHGFASEAQHPSLVWPDDHAWAMVSEIDFDSTIVAGSAELVAAICADERLEAAEIQEGDALHRDADTVNA